MIKRIVTCIGFIFSVLRSKNSSLVSLQFGISNRPENFVESKVCINKRPQTFIALY
jgi:hypothetical protein